VVELRSGDVWPGDAVKDHLAERAEVGGFGYPQPFETPLPLAFNMYINPGPPVTSEWCVLGQLHPAQDGISPAWSQEFDAGDVFKIIARNSPTEMVLFEDKAFKRGQHYAMKYLFKYGAKGLLQAWRDGIQIVDYSGALGYGGTVGPWWKFGIYRNPSPETLVVQYSNVQFG
jgi:hypothetical protein